jgi:hypothetical protein
MFAAAKAKRGDAHLFVLALGCAFVLGIVMKIFAMLFTAWMRQARAFAGGRRLGAMQISAKPVTVAAGSTQPISLLFMFRTFRDLADV